ncbi:metallophosphoesterase [Cyclobacterium sp.]|uniref:metallophosphoesterase family protein n=1 Tax=Cyclobacterium sp. TaxID=1966343 RepID=UPI0019BD9161|nr:metallophosphoesterase [Cyclobacterium sp.]MBD3628513.1 metallophosphoesterase [Cyclobacterium sp.]
MKNLIYLVFVLLICPNATAQESKWESWFWPNKGLPRNANSPLFQDSLSLRPFRLFQGPEIFPLVNQPASAIYKIDLDDLLDTEEPWIIEFWLINHVNQPIGFEVFLEQRPLLSNWNKKWLLPGREETQRFWDKYFTHLVLSNEENGLRIYENGDLLFQGEKAMGQVFLLRSYLQEEPFMKLDHWVKHLSFFSGPMAENWVNERFRQHQRWKKEGIRIPGKFHFLAEPYLYVPGSNQMQITFELDRKAEVKLLFGEDIRSFEALELSPQHENRYHVRLNDLKSNSPYFYEIEATDEKGNILKSGPLTFRTAPEKNSPILVGLVSDTESRPQINEQIGMQLWNERVDLVLHLGDITDGGNESEKWQWTQEFFPGSSALYSRIPNIPVAGNGEGDLFWYKAYHPQADSLGCYSTNYGPATFFVLNSNQPGELQKGGAQYEWLKNELSQSKSPWKFVMMHHAPYSMDEDDYGDTWQGKGSYGDRRFQPLLRLLEDFDVDMMFFGHLHTYMRSFPLNQDQIDFDRGITYVQVGGMGGNLEDFAPNRVPFSAKTFRGFHYGTISITLGRLELRVYTGDGKLIDIFEVRKKN